MIASQPTTRRWREGTIDGVLLLIFTLVALVFVIPFIILVVTSVRSDPDFLTHGVFSIPQSFRWSNFVNAWQTGDFGTTYRNSALITIVKVPLGLLVSALAAYPLAKMRFRLSGAIFIFFVAGLAVPIHVALLPLFVLEKNMGLLGTLWALLPPYVAFGIPFQVFVLRGFMRLIPSELIEAARVDGAHDLMIFARVMIPLITPGLATLFIIDAVATWNEFLIALVMLPSADVHTLPLGLLNFFNQFTGSYTQLSAGLVIGVIPLLILYVFLQRYLVSGLVGGAIKG
jgi:raffinose/stachyose/melibiose transport system permease protein